MDPILIGYFPKSVGPGGSFPGAEFVFSVGGCLSPGPRGWVDLWRHNEMAVYDSERIAEGVVRDAYLIEVTPDPAAAPPWKVTLRQEPFPHGEMLAYKMFPVWFRPDGEEPFPLPKLDVQPLPAGYERLGYDIVVCDRGCTLGFGCSPLSCNGRGGDLGANRYSLLDDPEQALREARDIALSKGQKGEPGSYVVIEVWRRLGPPLERSACAGAPGELSADLIRHSVRGPLRCRMEAPPPG